VSRAGANPPTRAALDALVAGDATVLG
jgi:hypothetical protein